MAPRFIFVRHGEATHNVAFHEEGESAFQDEKHRDAQLTEKGKEQACKLAQELASYKILELWCSPLTRCIQTAEEIFEETSCNTLYLHDNLLERQGGSHVCNERKTKSELQNLYPCWKFTYLSEFPSRWKERENQTSLYTRMLMFVLVLAHLYGNYNEDSYIVIVGHNDAISALIGKSLKNCEYSICTLQEILKN